MQQHTRVPAAATQPSRSARALSVDQILVDSSEFMTCFLFGLLELSAFQHICPS